MHANAVEIDGLTRRFGSFTAVDHISLTISRGEIYAFLGPNGAGKSTTIKMLTGLLHPSEGNGTVGGFDIRREAEKIKQNIGYMSQKFSLYNDLTPEENIAFFGGIYNAPTERIRKRSQYLFESTGIGRTKGSPTANLPLGLKQRLALECAMLHNPSILFLDEPTAGVDPSARREFWDIIYSVSQQGTTVFLTTHYMDEAEHADRIGMIFGGKLKASGTPQELKDNYSGGKIYQFVPEDLIEAVGILQESSEVKEATIFGTKIHITVEKEFGREAVHTLLEKSDIRYSSLSESRPSLEDVFIGLTSEDSRQ